MASTDQARKPHAILAMAYVLSRWGKSDMRTLFLGQVKAGYHPDDVAAAMEKLVELRQTRVEGDTIVWTGEPYVG